MDIDRILKEMTLEDKISFCTGADFWRTKAMEKYGIPAVMMSDGPHGLRCQPGETDMIGINRSVPATCFPTAVTAGATWNPELFAEEGKAIAEEALANGVSIVLGPGSNIKRNPLCGRNFEYLSEDPYLAGEMAAAFISGQQSTGASSSLKHFALNNQEFKRQNGDSIADDRAMRELYLAPFERAVKKAQPGTVMCSYNKINGVHASDNHWLLTEVLREEWGFRGMVVTDWGALNDRVEGFRAGCDLNMPGGCVFMEKDAADAVREGRLPQADIDASVRRILKLVEAAQAVKKGEPADYDAHNALACRIAEQGAVLLKNEAGLLPARAEELVLIGTMADDYRYQGAGSSHINPTRLTSLTKALPGVPFCPCCDKNGSVTEAELRRAQEAAKRARIAVVVAGLPESAESEGFDREHMAMPEGHNRMIEAVAAANRNTVVVLLGGSPMELPWADKVRSILYMGLSGQAGGQACADLLTGKAVPCGKLTESWPMRYADVVSADTFGKKNTEYRESIYVGYRYYEKAGVPVRFPFGHGLSYTSFTYSDLKTDGSTVTATVTNTGSTAGAEVAQLYIAAPQNGIHRPLKELKGFARVELQPGESRELRFMLDDRSFALWEHGWKVQAGSYELQLGASSADIRLRAVISVAGEELPAPAWQKGSWYETCSGKPTRAEWLPLMGRPVPETPEPKKGAFTMDSTCMEMKDASLVAKLQYKVTESIIAKGFGGKKDYSDPSFKMMMTCAADCPLRSVVISAGGMMKESLAKGLLEIYNGHPLRGVRTMLKK